MSQNVALPPTVIPAKPRSGVEPGPMVHQPCTFGVAWVPGRAALARDDSRRVAGVCAA